MGVTRLRRATSMISLDNLISLDPKTSSYGSALVLGSVAVSLVTLAYERRGL